LNANITGVMSKKAAIVGVLAVAAIGLAVDHQLVQRTHDRNMLTAEQFKREFDQQVPVGASLKAVEDYLSSKPVRAQPDISSDNFVRELIIEVVSERSPIWGCGRGSVGIIAKFTEERLQRTELADWSFDCLALPLFSP
jgi:hypothetical protein